MDEHHQNSQTEMGEGWDTSCFVFCFKKMLQNAGLRAGS
jgi:hypothetical protein